MTLTQATPTAVLKSPHAPSLKFGDMPQLLSEYYIETLKGTVPDKLIDYKKRKGRDPQLKPNLLVAHQQLLAALLGKAILNSTRRVSLLQSVESVRAQAGQTRTPDTAHSSFNHAALEATLKVIQKDGISLNDIGDAFRLFLTLAQISDAVVKTEQNQPITEATLKSIGSNKFIQAKLAQVTPIRIVTTMHPTDMANVNFTKAVNRLFRHYYATYKQAQDRSVEAGEFKLQKLALERAMAMLLKAQFDKTTSPSVQDEIKQNISYYASLYSALPMLKQNLTEKIGPLADNQPIFTLGTWVGGDMDGNPNVTYKTLDMALTQSAIEIARLYRASLKKMSETAETMGLFNVAGAIEELRQTLNTERITKLQNSQILVEHQRVSDNIHPPAALPQTVLGSLSEQEFPVLPSPQAFLQALRVIFDELSQDMKGLNLKVETRNQFEDLQAQYQGLVTRIHTFGFHFSSIDVRQDAALVHQNTFRQLPKAAQTSLRDKSTPPNNAAEPQPPEALLNNPKWQAKAIKVYEAATLANAHSRAVQQEDTDVLPMFQVAHAAQRLLGAPACRNVILSLTRSAADVMAALYLIQQAGLLQVDAVGQVTASQMDITPLFEKSEALENAVQTMTTLFNNGLYRQHLAQRGDRQLIMLGFSDGIKDAGLFSNAWLMYKTQRDLIALAQKYGVKLEFYYGRGGNPIRGGGSTERAVNSLAAGSFNHPHHLTEQGEVLARYYSIPEMAEMRLEQALMAVLKKAKNDDTRTGQTTTAAAPLQLFETLSERSKRHYQALIAQPGFVKFYNHLTPYETKYIHRGSRPSTRYQSEESFENIRAIPWVFQWTQSRVLLPGWYGLGTAMADMADMAKSNPEKMVKTLARLYNDVPFFKNSIDNCALTLHQADFDVARYYFNQLVPTTTEDKTTFQGFMDTLEVEYRLTQHWVSAIIAEATTTTHHKNEAPTAWADPKEQEAWQYRRSYIDPLHVIQANVAAQYRRKLKDLVIPTELLAPNLTKTQQQTLALLLKTQAQARATRFNPFRAEFTTATGGIAAGLGTTG